MTVLLTFLAGACGAVLRFVVDDACRRRWPGVFPGPTVLINMSGSLVIGVVAGAVMFHNMDDAWLTVVGTGLCGGYTTFSTSVLETVRFGDARGAVYAVGTVVGSIAACAAGLLLVHAL